MAVQIVRSNDQVFNESYNGSIMERTVIALPQQRSALKQYSNLFYWSYHTSDYGCTLPELSNIGFEIITYVTKGSYDVYHKEKDSWSLLEEGDMAFIRSGKGIRYAEKLHPRSEILQVWFNPNFSQQGKLNAQVMHCPASSFPVNTEEGKKTSLLGGKGSALCFQSDDITIELKEFNAGFHTIDCPKDSVISCHVLHGYIEVEDVTLGRNDFFKIEGATKVKIASLVNSRLFATITPYIPEYQSKLSMRR